MNLKRLLKKVVKDDPLSTVERACALTQLVASAEYLADKGNRERGGLNDWTYLRSQFPVSEVASFWDKLDAKKAEKLYQGLHMLRIAHSTLLLAPVKNNQVRACCNLFQVASYLVLQPRQFYGTDGSDQLSFLGHAAAGVGRLGGSRYSRKAASDFLALQVVLSYLISGVVKAPGKRWAQGDALERVMGTETYGDKKFYDFLQHRPRIGMGITKGTVVIESLMPLSLFNRKTLKMTLALFGAFHLANAREMGLGRFVLPFISSYPAILALQDSLTSKVDEKK